MSPVGVDSHADGIPITVRLSDRRRIADNGAL
jgi:hypothetical protein